MNCRILTVFAHPDDEMVTSGMFAKYAAEGHQVYLVCATRGEMGEISDPALADRDTLGKVREQELRCTCDYLGINPPIFLDYKDSGMKGTPANQDPACFLQAPAHEAVGRLVKIMRRIRPHIVVTYEPSGWYGHPDHITGSRHTTAAYYQAGSKTAYPEAGEPWQPHRLFHAIVARSSLRALFEAMENVGLDISGFEQFNEPDPWIGKVTHVMEMPALLRTKREALACHTTQYAADHPMNTVPDEEIYQFFGVERFIQVDPPLEPGPQPIGDLLEGVCP